MTPHIEAKIGDIAKTVLMPGDPLRAKYIAEKFLTDVKIVNKIRNMYAYTGFYKNKQVTIMGSGMGMPSMGIYCYELYKIYNVENIIRIGSCGAYKSDLNLLDIILVDKSYTEGNFAYSMCGKECHLIDSNEYLNSVIINTANTLKIKCLTGTIACSEFFDPYLEDPQALAKRIPKDLNTLGSEMESFALFYVAKQLNKKASALVTVSDSIYKNTSITAKQREASLDNMIKLALETSLNL